MPKKIVYLSPRDITAYDANRFQKSLQRYGDFDWQEVKQALEDEASDLLHVSVLVTIGTMCLKNDEDAKRYYLDHKQWFGEDFVRLRRITGYLVGSLERWNDAKKAEEKARVKHSINAKDQREAEKLEQFISNEI